MIPVLILASAALVVDVACGTDTGAPADGGVDGGEAGRGGCNIDFPCLGPFQCTSNGAAYYANKTLQCADVCGEPCSGATCVVDGPPVDCPDATLCVQPRYGRTGPTCAPLGDPGCIPGDAGGFDAGSAPYAAATQDVCSQQDITDYLGKCVHGFPTQCAAYKAAHLACFGCLESNLGPRTGPLPALVVGNVAGCLALVTGDSSSTGCAAKWVAAEGCVETACSACGMARQGGDPIQGFAACIAAARATSCKALVDAACAPPDGGATSVCYESDPDKFLTEVAPLFCSAGG